MLTPKAGLTGNNGSSLVEILIALGIFAIVVSATALVFFGGQEFAAGSIESRTGVEKARTGAEALRIIRDKKWTDLTDGIHGLQFLASGSWQLTGSPDVSDGFTRTVSISTDFDGIKHIDLTVSWYHLPEGTRSIEFSQTLSPLEEGLKGDWEELCVVGSVDAGSGSKGSDVFYLDGKAYVTDSAAAASKPDLYIFNFANPLAPTLLGQLNVEQGEKSVTVAGNYAYTIEENSPDFFVIDVSNPATPLQKAKLTLAGGSGRYVMVRGNYVFATTTNNASGAEFFVIDVTTPTTPSVVGSLEIGGNVNEVNVLKNVAYLATGIDTKELMAVDVTTPASPTILGSYDAAGSADGLAVHAKSKNRVYLGRASSSDKELFVLDATTPSAITTRGSVDTSDTINSLMTAATLTFLGMSDTNEEFQVYYVKDPTAMYQYAELNFSNNATGAVYYNNYVYMSVQNSDVLQIISSCGS